MIWGDCWLRSEPVRRRYLAESFVLLPGGDMLLLPYHSPKEGDGTNEVGGETAEEQPPFAECLHHE